VAKDSKTTPKSHAGLSDWQQQAVAMLSGCLLFVCWLAIHFSNPLVALIGLGCSIGFIWAFFHRQIKEEFLAYQGPSGNLPISQFATTPKIVVPEESLLLWLLVTALALIAFISLDLATRTAFSLLAIPFSIAGGLWSYRRRHLAKHWLTHLVFWAALVLVVFCLGSAFWAQMIEKAKDFLGTDRDLVVPLALGFLLVALQTIRMWSLCYKRGLSSSVVISVMLMASTLAIGNNPGFLLVLALFVGLLVPTLMLFYRSTIKLKPIGVSIVPRPQQLTERHVPWQYLTKITILALVLGGILALFAPHLKLPDVSWDLPGLDQLVKNLPIETEPTIVQDAEGDAENSELVSGDNSSAGELGTAGKTTKSQSSGKGGGAAGTQQSDDHSEDAEYIDEQQAQQAIQNILATADRPLPTSAERIAYITKYLQEHVSSTDCKTNSLNCSRSFHHNNKHHQNALALGQLAGQIPLRSYYVAQQPTSKSPPLLQQLTVPCPADQPSCYKNRVFQADQQETSTARNRLLRSISGIDPLSDDPIQSNASPGSSSAVQGNKPLEDKALSANQRKGSTPTPGKSSTNKSVVNKVGKNLSQKARAAWRKLSPQEQAKLLSRKQSQRSIANRAPGQNSPSAPAKPPAINPEQLMIFLRLGVIILLFIGGVIWYLWWQGRKERVQKQKDRKFNQRPMIERVYWLMLKELRSTGSIKRSTETEWEFVLSNDPQYPGLLGKLITEISHDYIAWHYGKKPPNEASLTQKFERFRELHSAELAKRQAEKNFISQSKKVLHLVK
jgi:hypothetical protein